MGSLILLDVETWCVFDVWVWVLYFGLLVGLCLFGFVYLLLVGHCWLFPVDWLFVVLFVGWFVGFLVCLYAALGVIVFVFGYGCLLLLEFLLVLLAAFWFLSC